MYSFVLKMYYKPLFGVSKEVANFDFQMSNTKENIVERSYGFTCNFLTTDAIRNFNKMVKKYTRFYRKPTFLLTICGFGSSIRITYIPCEYDDFLQLLRIKKEGILDSHYTLLREVIIHYFYFHKPDKEIILQKPKKIITNSKIRRITF